MTRCVCCNKNLSDFEATRRSASTGEFLDMCNNCITDTGIATKDRRDLLTEEGTNSYIDDDEGLDKIEKDTIINYVDNRGIEEL
jgi:hypothetical protein